MRDKYFKSQKINSIIMNEEGYQTTCCSNCILKVCIIYIVIKNVFTYLQVPILICVFDFCVFLNTQVTCKIQNRVKKFII